MPKKDPTPNPSNVQNKDIIQRLNFLYQASVYLTSLSHDTPSSERPSGSTDIRQKGTEENKGRRGKKKTRSSIDRKRQRQQVKTTDELARAYIDTMTTVGKRTTVKMDPSIKRTVCKQCKSVLVPGVSVSVRIKRSSSHRHALSLTCTTCGFGRIIPAPPRAEPSASLADGSVEGSLPGCGVGDEGKNEVDSAMSMEVDESKQDPAGNHEKAEAGNAAGGNKKGRRRAKHKTGIKRVYPPLPLALRRDAGHVVFRGNEAVHGGDVEEFGDGLFAV